MDNINVENLIGDLNTYGKKVTFEKHGINEKKFTIIKKENNIRYDNRSKVYLINKHEEESINKEDVKTIDIYDFFKDNKDNAVDDMEISIDNNEKDELSKEAEEKDIKVISKKNESNKSKNKKTSNKEGFDMYNLEINKCLLKALEFKALTENVSLNDLLNNLLEQSVEKKYYIG